jgi:hypothetical protein
MLLVNVAVGVTIGELGRLLGSGGTGVLTCCRRGLSGGGCECVGDRRLEDEAEPHRKLMVNLHTNTGIRHEQDKTTPAHQLTRGPVL